MSAPVELRLLEADTTAAVILGASDWRDIGLGLAPSFRRSVRGIQRYLFDHNGLSLDPELVLDLFDDPAPAAEQLARLRDTLDELLRERREAGRPVADLLIYYVGHGITDDAGRLTLLVRRSRKGLEAETGIKAADLARVLKVSAPQQRRLVVLDCCFSEAAAKDFIGMATLDQAVAASAANDLAEALPGRGGLLLCSSPVGKFSIGNPDAPLTLFTGAVIEVLRHGVSWCESSLSFLDIRDEAYNIMLQSFGAAAPRPALHAFNQSQGDLARLPAFPNRGAPPVAEAKARRNKEEEDRLIAEEADRFARKAANDEAIAKAQKAQKEKDRLAAAELQKQQEAARLAQQKLLREAELQKQQEAARQADQERRRKAVQAAELREQQETARPAKDEARQDKIGSKSGDLPGSDRWPLLEVLKFCGLLFIAFVVACGAFGIANNSGLSDNVSTLIAIVVLCIMIGLLN